MRTPHWTLCSNRVAFWSGVWQHFYTRLSQTLFELSQTILCRYIDWWLCVQSATARQGQARAPERQIEAACKLQRLRRRQRDVSQYCFMDCYRTWKILSDVRCQHVVAPVPVHLVSLCVSNIASFDYAPIPSTTMIWSVRNIAIALRLWELIFVLLRVLLVSETVVDGDTTCSHCRSP